MRIIRRDNIKKKDIVKNVNSNIGIPKVYASKILNDLIYILTNNLILNKIVKIKNFGTLILKKKNKRQGRNPKNLKTYEIIERNVVTFKISEYLKKKINSNVEK